MKPIGFLIEDSPAWARENGVLYDSSCYGPEFLEQAGFDFTQYSAQDLADAFPPLVWVNGSMPHSQAVNDAVHGYLRRGGRVLITGDIRGLDFLLERPQRAALYLASGYLSLEGVPGEFGSSRKSRFPVRSAYLRQDLEFEQQWGAILDESGKETGTPAVAYIRIGKGVVAWIPVDVCRCALEFQQGVPVFADGEPPGDGTAPINDGILKCDDGSVYDWQDRALAGLTPGFLTAPVDWLREWFIRVAWWLAGTNLPQVWYWPRGIEAVSSLSHDSDSNESKHAWALMDLLAELNLKSTWCVMYPGGYDRDVYRALAQSGHEIALHFEAFSGDEYRSWSRECLRYQHEWLKAEAGIDRAFSQKNHLTRWEGWTTFFRWLEEEGIQLDQSKGPSKMGNMGFLFGTCHVWRPMDDNAHGNRILNVLESSYLTADMYGGIERRELRRRILDEAVQGYGVAHFLFHPQRINEPGMAAGIRDIVEYGRQRQTPWWTGREIGEWVLARRSVSIEEVQSGEWEVYSDRAVSGVTITLPSQDVEFELDGQPVDATLVERHGMACSQVTLDLQAGQPRRLAKDGNRR